MQGIETLHEKEGFSVNSVLYRWRGMIFSLVEISESDGTRFLYANLDGAIPAGRITERLTGKWTISSEAEAKPAAGVSTISNGSVPGVTEPSTTASQE
jgi:hypothetical protein